VYQEATKHKFSIFDHFTIRMTDLPGTLFEKISAGDRVSLGQAMTLVESERQADRRDAVDLLERCDQKLKGNDRSIRLTISGAPGVGKSTLIESLGQRAMADGYKVGVITVDPSSTISQGSILGDKSRMNQLSVAPNAFIRSSPAGQVLGGLGRRTMEMMTLLAAAGYEVIFLETVGVGQSEHAAWKITDGFVLVIQPGAGDELQGIKRGITELADIVIVNKADQQLANLARIAKGQYENALHLFRSTRHEWNSKVVTCSSIEGHGVDDVWQVLRLYIEHFRTNLLSGELRARQQEHWLQWSVGMTAQKMIMEHPAIKQQLEEAVQSKRSTYRTEYEIESLMQALIHSTDEHRAI
jgi:LAO/AO transport system kinase